MNAPVLPSRAAAEPQPAADAPPLAPPSGADPAAAAHLAASARLPAAWLWGAGVVAALSVASLTLALMGQQRARALEQELVRRQQDSQTQAIEARTVARQAQELAQAAEAKVGLLDARVSEAALQRSQFEDLIQQLSRSRDENVLADVDAAVRVAVQQSALTGSAEPLMAALRQAEERLARLSQPRIERVRRAVARDLDRVRASAGADVASLAIKLDEVVRQIDELPLVAEIERRGPAPAAAASHRSAAGAAPAASAAAASATSAADLRWWQRSLAQAQVAAGRVWTEVRGLIRVSRVDNKDTMLVAPEQAWFVRENMKLRVLNARLGLLSRQFDITQHDLREVQAVLDRYFDRQARKVQLTAELLRQVSGQARALNLPRPDETLSALAAAQAGR